MGTDAPRVEEVCTLPGGLVLEDGRRLGEVELRPLSGAEEDWLARHPAVPSAAAVSRVLSACLVRLEDLPGDAALVRSLLVGDRDYLMLRLRGLTLGDHIRAVFVCPACTAKMDVDLSASAVPMDQRVQTVATHALQLERGAMRRTVRFRLPTGGDQEAVACVDPQTGAEMLLDRCLLDDGGTSLSPDEREAVAAEMERLAPELDLELDLTCPECGHAFVVPFDVTTFFFAEVRAESRHLLREVHELALYYHWSEAEILALVRPRRRAYLDLLSDALRQG